MSRADGNDAAGGAVAPLHVQSLRDAPVRRIQPSDTNRFVLLVDPARHGTDFVQVLEIFDAGGRTPPNVHLRADESFFVLHGQGEAHCDGRVVPLRAGTALLLRAGVPHVVVNTGTGRLYCLTTMVPDEDFARLIRDGVPDRLDDADWAVLAPS